MYPPKFDYHRAETLDEAVSLLETRAEDDPRILAGGHALLPELKNDRASPGVLVDIGDVDELSGVEVGDDETTVGALTTYADLAESGQLWERATVIAEAASEVGDLQIRNRGTIGGNLAQADPDGDLPAAAVAADAAVLARGPDGAREIPAAEFFVGANDTALAEAEIVTGVRVPHAGVQDADERDADGRDANERDAGERDADERDAGSWGGAYAKKTHPASGYAMVGVAAVVAVADGEVTAARVSASGTTDAPVRLAGVEDALVGESPDERAVESAARRAADGLDPTDLRSDVYASGEFRAQLLGAYAERALESAVARATGENRAPGGAAGSAGGDSR